MRDDALAGVGKTALGVAMVRAGESRREDALFHDPYAAAFVAAAPGVFDAEQHSAATDGDTASWGMAFYEHAVVRTRFFDDVLLRAVEQGLRQVVLLAAGLDTRAYRLDWPAEVALFELDRPEVLRFKDAVLGTQAASGRCRRVPVAADLAGWWTEPLITAGFDPGRPTVWLAEGLLIYLSPDEAGRLLATVGDLSAPGSRLALEHGSGDASAARPEHPPGLAEYAALWRGGLADARGWLADRGWSPQVQSQATLARTYGRTTTGFAMADFITAELASTSTQNAR